MNQSWWQPVTPQQGQLILNKMGWQVHTIIQQLFYERLIELQIRSLAALIITTNISRAHNFVHVSISNAPGNSFVI